MKPESRPTVARFVTAFALATSLSACESADDPGIPTDSVADELDCSQETRAEPYTVGLTKSGRLVDVSFVSATPAPPGKTENIWRIVVTDRATTTPVEGVTIQVIPLMPDHGHGTTKDAVVTPVGDTPGHYDLAPVFLHMAGYWEVSVKMTLADDTQDEVMFQLCVDN